MNTIPRVCTLSMTIAHRHQGARYNPINSKMLPTDRSRLTCCYRRDQAID
jgi:hypothetical protein